MKTGKHEYLSIIVICNNQHNIAVIYNNYNSLLLLYCCTRAYPFLPDEVPCYIFWFEVITAGSLHFMLLLCKLFINHASKCQFVVLLWYIHVCRFSFNKKIVTFKKIIFFEHQHLKNCYDEATTKFSSI